MATVAARGAINCCRSLFFSASRQIGKSSTFVYSPCVGVRCWPTVVSCQTCRRWQTTASGAGETTYGEIEEEKEESWLEKVKKRSWLWRWLNDIHEIEARMMTEEEYNERERMVEKLMDRYFDTPDAKFDLDIFGEIFDLLIKYNDREAVKMFWSLMEEMQVEPDPEMREKVEKYLVKAKEESWAWW
ncbi:hypothetical protein ABFA07_001586 [Porites harrisoni]